ncbi:hypothetical protein M430DRAFT_275643 [Amorphotheca resinae ATCC 22711]|uniref:Uncharacterized protein n=1 Tax=Amorphotheca resinae ATCC 22711 TaxID=857342 RepID=A0A2T3B509_AMORE|nr:hypothetical protein M430DRAFT_275643 [Amorphotheca resinae ATCC 22711]PSS20722.1 hypothetical protein M430DRAFT_275643 [Amorphotheca resinae ATCC 22711]
MGRRKEIINGQRSRTCELHSVPRGAEFCRGPTTVIIYGTQSSSVENQPKPRSGTPRKLSEEQRNNIFDASTIRTPILTNRVLGIQKLGSGMRRPRGPEPEGMRYPGKPLHRPWARAHRALPGPWLRHQSSAHEYRSPIMLTPSL